MDSVTQIALGAAVGHVAGGHVLGRRALAWGAVLGTLPDLDALYPFADAVSAFTWHRGYSHSLIVLTAVAPLLAWAGVRWHGLAGPARWHWLLAVWLCLVTHPLLDACTIYGTQLLLPLTDHPFGLGSIFIIDPLYTLPLLVGVTVAALAWRDRDIGVRFNRFGLVLSTVYLAAGIAVQQGLTASAQRALAARDVEGARVLVQPTPFNTVLWRVLARVPGGYWEGYRSLLDPEAPLALTWYASDDEALARLPSRPAAARLQWFSKGLYGVLEVPGGMIISDLRMGLEPFYVFSFLLADGGAAAAPVRRVGGQRPLGGALRLLWERAVDPAVRVDAVALRAVAGLPACADPRRLAAGETGTAGTVEC